jgi:hypothetical protein
MRSTIRSLAGLALVIISFLAYLKISTRYEAWRATTWPNWIALGLGIAIALLAVVRPRRPARRLDQIGAALALLLALAVAGVFARYTITTTRDMPVPPADKVALGRELPDVTLTTADGRPFHLLQETRSGELKGRTLLLLFFRGTW